MPQSIFIQVGQCGNQIGCRFWDLALQEYQHHKILSLEDISNFFKPVDVKNKSNVNILDAVKARAIMIDMEEGVISDILRGPFKRLFDRKQLVTDVSGSGNNWAMGNKFYGSKYHDKLTELFRKEAEECDSLQCFFLLHSMGGGTGSGLGTAVLEYLHDEFRKIPRFVFAVFPSIHDDVVTSPYNTVLANSQLINFADCVIPFENKALGDICNKVSNAKNNQPHGRYRADKSENATSVIGNPRDKKACKPFDEMNNIVANTILNLTCSSRFPGSLNVDLNEIIMNMTPYPHLHYLVPSAAPLFSFRDSCKVDQMLTEAFSMSHQLFQSPLSQGMLLACALLCRGQVSMSDVQHNIDRLKANLKFVPWNEEGWKIGLCNVPHIGCRSSVLMLANTSSITHSLCLLQENFMKMYRKKAHLHHFLEVECMEKDIFRASLNDLVLLIQDYKNIEKVHGAEEVKRLKVAM